MKYYLGIDLGTSSVKVVVLDEEGSIIAIERKEYPILVPFSGFAEQSTDEWWNSVCICTQNLIRKNLFDKYQIVSIGLSGQMHGLVALNSRGKPLRNAIIWLDRRSTEICNQWASIGYNEEFHNITGLTITTGYLAPSLAWVKKNEPDIYKNIYKIVLPKDYIRYKLTETISTERSDASGTYLFDIINSDWSDQIIKELGFKYSILPKIQKTLEMAGYVTKTAAQQTGLPQGIPVATGGSDQAMAAISLGVKQPGIVAVGINTGGTTITTIEKPIFDPRLHTLCHAYPNKWLLMGATLSAGIAVSWFRKQVITQSQSMVSDKRTNIEELSDWASKILPGSEGLFFIPYLTGERTPHMNPNAKGGFIGLTLSHSVNHMVRSIMEGVAYSMCDSLDIYREIGLLVDELIGYGGGSNSALWCQIICDVFNVPLKKYSYSENSAIGAAITGAIAIQEYSDYLNSNNKIIANYYPIQKNVFIYEKARNTFKKIYKQLVDIFDELSEFTKV